MDSSFEMNPRKSDKKLSTRCSNTSELPVIDPESGGSGIHDAIKSCSTKLPNRNFVASVGRQETTRQVYRKTTSELKEWLSKDGTTSRPRGYTSAFDH